MEHCRIASKVFHVDTPKKVEERRTIVRLAKQYSGDANRGLAIAIRIYCVELIHHFIKKAKDWNWAMSKAAREGRKDLVLFFIGKGAYHWDLAMAEASKHYHKDLVKFFMEKGANDWDWAMRAAAGEGHKDLVLLFINNGANDWNEAMTEAAEGGHKDLVLFFIEVLG